VRCNARNAAICVRQHARARSVGLVSKTRVSLMGFVHWADVCDRSKNGHGPDVPKPCPAGDAIFPGLQKAGMEASFVRAKFLHRTESKDDASRDAYAVLVLVSPRQEAGEAGQHVIHCHRPEAKALADPYVKAAPRRHGKRSL